MTISRWWKRILRRRQMDKASHSASTAPSTEQSSSEEGGYDYLGLFRRRFQSCADCFSPILVSENEAQSDQPTVALRYGCETRIRYAVNQEAVLHLEETHKHQAQVLQSLHLCLSQCDFGWNVQAYNPETKSTCTVYPPGDFECLVSQRKAEYVTYSEWIQ